MKRITSSTFLKQGEKIFSPVYSNQVIYWRDENLQFVAQTKPILEILPVIDIKNYIEDFLLKRFPEDGSHHNRMFQAEGWKKCLKESEFQYSQKDIERVIEIIETTPLLHKIQHPWERQNQINRILDKINSITTIEVDQNFKIINYE